MNDHPEQFATSAVSSSLKLAGAEKLCRIYFEIAAEVVGEEEVRRRRDIRIQAAGSKQATQDEKLTDAPR